jgi:nitrogen permease regulator 3-like protein
MSTLWREILDKSSLAASMQDIYEAVSHNRIAALQLDTTEGTVTHSVQIPVPFYVPDLPAADDDITKGLWITTANSFVAEDKMDDPVFLDKNFGLLLMSDESRIIAELNMDKDETTAAMEEFVKLSKPTLSYVFHRGTRVLIMLRDFPIIALNPSSSPYLSPLTSLSLFPYLHLPIYISPPEAGLV